MAPAPTTDSPVVARASGVLDTANAARLEGELLALTSSGRPVVVDLADVELMDSGVVSALLSVARHARRAGGKLVVRHPSGVVSDVLRVAALDDRLLSIEAAA